MEKNVENLKFDIDPKYYGLVINVETLNAPLNKIDVARVVAMTLSYINTRLVAKPIPLQLEKDLVFQALFQGLISELLNSKVEYDYDTMKNQLSGRDEANTIMFFANQNLLTLIHYNEENWEKFIKSAFECIHYTSGKFYEPVICMNYCNLVLRSPINFSNYYRLKEKILTEFGNSCAEIKYTEGVLYAVDKLKAMGVTYEML